MINELDGSADIQKVTVGLGHRQYDIHVGPCVVDQLGAYFSALAPGRQAMIITDETVAGHHLQTVMKLLEEADVPTHQHQVPPGEGSKSFACFNQVCEAVLHARLERDDILIALGGGVVGDLVGFVAGVVRRGMRFIQIPTSLLAQVDSSVGGKTGINAPQGKNLIGLFHQPVLVLADTTLLDTLSPRHLRAGYAEVAKYGLLGDASFFDWLEQHGAEILHGGARRTQAIAQSCRYKARIVEADEREQGQRALLNLGHTFGHALERATGYSDRLLHGEAVSIGMSLAFAFSNRLNLSSTDETSRVTAHLAAMGLPIAIAEIPGEPLQLEGLMDGIRQDKKVKQGALTFILARQIGDAFVADDVPPSEVSAFLAEQL